MAAAISGELVICFGEMLIDFVPDVAGVSLADCKAFVKAAGGAPANVAVAVARLGGRPAFIGKVGNDEFGHMLVNILKVNDVNTAGVRFDKDARTALAFVTLTRSGEREFMFYRNPSADMLLTKAELDFDLIRRASIFHFGSISLISEPCRSTHLAAIAAARKAGALLTYDVNIRIPLWPSPQAARRGVMSIWNQADVIKVSDDEVAFLTQGDPENDDVIKSLWFDDLKLLVVTAGEKGSRYLTKNFQGMVPGYAVEKVDATGAGDAFVGSLLVSIAKDKNIFEDEKKLRNALVFASACGAITATKKGAIPALPTPTLVEDFIANPKLIGSNKELIVDGEERNPSLRRRKGGVGNGSTIGYRSQRPQFEADATSKFKKSSKLVVAISIGFILTFLLALITKLYWVRSN